MAAGESILVIDDEEDMRDSCCQALRRVGYRAEAAEDGARALRKIREATPDLVLVDLKMPGISGMEVLERITKIAPNIIRIVITGYGTVDSAVEAMKLGACDFVCKPFTPEELSRVVERGLERRRVGARTRATQEEAREWKEQMVLALAGQLGDVLCGIERCLQGVARDLVERAREQGDKRK